MLLLISLWLKWTMELSSIYSTPKKWLFITKFCSESMQTGSLPDVSCIFPGTGVSLRCGSSWGGCSSAAVHGILTFQTYYFSFCGMFFVFVFLLFFLLVTQVASQLVCRIHNFSWNLAKPRYGTALFGHLVLLQSANKMPPTLFYTSLWCLEVSLKYWVLYPCLSVLYQLTGF